MKRGKILLVDDDEKDLFTTKKLLEKAGYMVIENLGWLGITKNVKYLQPDLVLLDVNMPALSGDLVCDLIKEFTEKSKIPVLFYSSYDEVYLREMKTLKGIADYIVKGDIFQLYRKISLHMKKRGNN